MTQTLLTHTAGGTASRRLIAECVACPACGSRATVEWRTRLDSTAGPVEHLKIRCLGGQFRAFFMPGQTEMVDHVTGKHPVRRPVENTREREMTRPLIGM